MASGVVKCCLCRSIFNAKQYLTTSLPDSIAAEEKTTTAAETAELSAKISAIRPTLDDVLARYNKPLINPEEELEKHATLPVSKVKIWNRLADVVSCAGLIAILIAQFAFFKKDAWAQNTDYRPLVETVCELVGCSVPLRSDTALLRLLERNVRTHPDFPNAILAQVTIANEAEFEQAYPWLEFSMSNIRGQIITYRRFSPNEYLPPAGGAEAGIPPYAIATITLELHDPGDDAVAYEFKFL